jgi:hypothetical protein
VATAAIVSTVLAAASTAVTLTAQKKQADAQTDYQEDLGKANVTAARIQAEQLRDQQAQANEATQREAQAAALASKQAKSTAVVSAGEAGVSGNSVEALLQEYRATEGRWMEAHLRQQQLTDVSTEQQLEALRINTDAGNLSMNAPVAQPNYLAGALSFGAQAASTYMIANPRTPKTATSSH